MKNIIICDVDGTLCSDAHRNHILHQNCETCNGSGTQTDEHGEYVCETCNGVRYKRTSKEWDEYFDLCHLDAPMEAVIKVLQEFHSGGEGRRDYEIHLMTARIERVKDKTVDWLRKHDVPYDSIRFRPTESRVQDNVLKTHWADALGGPERVLFVLEDRSRVVDAWRSAGYTCFQVAPGDF